jgi:hypothetical protein
MGSRAQRLAGRPDRPSAKPVMMVAGLLMSAALGAAVTTRPPPAPAHHMQPIHPIVVSRIAHPGVRVARTVSEPDWL